MIQPSHDHLHLGCGLNAPNGWLNVDGSPQVMLARHPAVARLAFALRLIDDPRKSRWSRDVLMLDLSKPLPFPPRAFAAVYASHLLEHLYYGEALALLRDIRRVLRPKGICRVVVPDLRATIDRYLSKGTVNAADEFMEELYVHARSKPVGIRGIYYRLTAMHQHKWMYDARSLVDLFGRAGFATARQADFLDSAIARIAEVEDPGRILDGQGIVVEATPD